MSKATYNRSYTYSHTYIEVNHTDCREQLGLGVLLRDTSTLK